MNAGGTGLSPHTPWWWWWCRWYSETTEDKSSNSGHRSTVSATVPGPVSHNPWCCCCCTVSRCLLISLWRCSGTTPTLANKDRSTFSSSLRSSIRFCRRSFSLTRSLTFSSVSLERSFAFSLDFRTAILFLSRRLRYSSLALSTDLPLFLLLL